MRNYLRNNIQCTINKYTYCFYCGLCLCCVWYSSSSGTSPSSSVLSTPKSATVVHHDNSSSVLAVGAELGASPHSRSGAEVLHHQNSNSSFSSLDRVSTYSTSQADNGLGAGSSSSSSRSGSRRHKRGVSSAGVTFLI